MNDKKWTEPKKAKTGVEKSKELVNNHVDCIEELQEEVDDLRKNEQGGNEREPMTILVVDDTELIRIEINATIVETDLE